MDYSFGLHTLLHVLAYAAGGNLHSVNCYTVVELCCETTNSDVLLLWFGMYVHMSVSVCAYTRMCYVYLSQSVLDTSFMQLSVASS